MDFYHRYRGATLAVRSAKCRCGAELEGEEEIAAHAAEHGLTSNGVRAA